MRKALLLLAVLISCAEENTPPENLIPEEIFIDLLVEMRVLQTFQVTYADSAKSVAYLDSLYLKFGVNQEQVLTSNYFYESNPDAHYLRKKIVESRLEKHLEKLEIEISSALRKQEQVFDTNNPAIQSTN